MPNIISDGVAISHITCSSDAQGSLPIIGDDGKFAGIGIGKPKSLYNEIKELLISNSLPKSDIISIVTKNVANILGLHYKGEIKRYNDADFILVDNKDYELKYVFSNGKKMMEEGKILAKETFY